MPLSSPLPSSTLVSSYQPGLHLLAELRGLNSGILTDFAETKAFLENQIEILDLTSLGSVFHNFPGGGFTAVICLTESHLSVHTWPEYGIITADVFLSNYQKDNSSKAKKIMQELIAFYECNDVHLTEINR